MGPTWDWDLGGSKDLPGPHICFMEDSKQHVIAISLEQERLCCAVLSWRVLSFKLHLFAITGDGRDGYWEWEISYHLDIFWHMKYGLHPTKEEERKSAAVVPFAWQMQFLTSWTLGKLFPWIKVWSISSQIPLLHGGSCGPLTLMNNQMNHANHLE